MTDPSRPSGRRFLPLADVAELLDCTLEEATGLVERGELHAIRLGERGPWRVDQDALQAFIQDGYERQAREAAFAQSEFTDLAEIGGGRILSFGDETGPGWR